MDSRLWIPPGGGPDLRRMRLWANGIESRRPSGDATHTLSIAHVRPDRLLTKGATVAVVILLAAGMGLATTLGPTGQLALYATGVFVTLLTIALVFNSPGLVSFMLVALGVLLAPSDGLRLATSITYSDALIVAAVPFLIWSFWTRASFPTLPSWLFVGTGFIILAALIIEELPSISHTQAIFQYRNLTTREIESGSSSTLAGQLLIALVVVPTIVALAVRSWKRAQILINFWLAGVAASCIVALLAAFAHINLQQAITGHDYSIQAYHEQAGRYTGLAVHAVLLGISAAMCVPIALSRMTSTKHAIRYGLLVCVYCLAVLVSGSRSALIGVVAALVIVFVWRARARKRIISLIFVAGGAAYVTGVSASSLSVIQRLLGGNTLASSSANTSDTARLSHYSEALQAFYKRPLTGYGFEGLRGAHNIILELLSSGGPLALVGYFVVIGGVLSAARVVHARIPANVNIDILGIVGAIVVFLVVSMVDNASLDRFVYLPIGIMLGLYFLVQHESVRDRQHELIARHNIKFGLPTLSHQSTGHMLHATLGDSEAAQHM